MGVEEITVLISDEFMPRGKFTADDVYSHPSGPMDLDMYLALALMQVWGQIKPLFEDSPFVNHSDMVYEAVKGVKDEQEN